MDLSKTLILPSDPPIRSKRKVRIHPSKNVVPNNYMDMDETRLLNSNRDHIVKNPQVDPDVILESFPFVDEEMKENERNPNKSTSPKVPFINEKYFETNTKSITTMLTANINNIDVVVKVSYEPLKITNSTMVVERLLYKTDINNLVVNNHCPFFVGFIDLVSCNNCTTVTMKNTKQNHLSDYDTKKQSLLILEKTKNITFHDMLDELCKNPLELISVVFQILWALMCFKRLRIKHNDFHAKNIFVERLDEDTKIDFVYENPIFQTEENNTLKFSLTTRYFVKIFDFDHASVYGNPEVPRNTSLNKTLCLKYGECNYHSSKFDLYRFSLTIVNRYDKLPHGFRPFLHKVLNVNDIKTRINDRIYYIKFDETLSNNMIEPVETWINHMLTFNWISSPFKKNPLIFSNNPITLPSKRIIRSWNPTNDGYMKHAISDEILNVSLLYDLIFERFLDNKSRTIKSGNEDIKLSEEIEVECQRLKGYNLQSEYETLLSKYLDKLPFLKTHTSLGKLVAPIEIRYACRIMACSVYHQILEKPPIDLFYNIDVIELMIGEKLRSIELELRVVDTTIKHMWSLFGNTLPIEIPHL